MAKLPSIHTVASGAIILTCAVIVGVLLKDAWALPPAAANTRPIRSRPAPPATPIDLGDAATKGDLNAPVAVVLYSDFLCPYCRRFASEVMP